MCDVAHTCVRAFAFFHAIYKYISFPGDFYPSAVSIECENCIHRCDGGEEVKVLRRYTRTEISSPFVKFGLLLLLSRDCFFFFSVARLDIVTAHMLCENVCSWQFDFHINVCD